MNLTCVAKYSLLLAGLILLVPVYATAADDKKNKVQQQNAGQVAALPRQVVNMSNRLIYHPPPRGVPVSRVSGASRSPQGRLILEVLASLHTGLTLQEQPNLYWYLTWYTSGLWHWCLILNNALTTSLPKGRFSALSLQDHCILN
jgi:hypothetical protein